MINQVELIFGLVISAMTVASTIWGLFMYIASTAKKEYAAQRDFEHLKNNYRQLAENQQIILREMDKYFNEVLLKLTEIKGRD